MHAGGDLFPDLFRTKLVPLAIILAPGSHRQAQEGGGIKLYKYVSAGQAGKWELATGNARPSFYDALEDSTASGTKSDWFLEVGAVWPGGLGSSPA